jgi:predicted dehydrogenase
MKIFKWGIIGCGDVTEIKSGPAFQSLEGSGLVAVMRRNGAKAKDYAQRHGVPKWYDDVDQLLNDPDINAVYIATPPDSHKDYAIKAIQKGLPVYVEKPFTLNAAEARELAQAVKENNAKLCVAHYRRRLPAFLFVKDLLDSGKIGDVRMVTLKMWQSPSATLIANVEDNWRVRPEVSGGGYFHDLAPHQLDLMYYYFGKPLHYDGIALNQAGLYAADDMVAGQLLFGKKIVFSGTWCFCAGEKEEADECTITGSKGKITFPIFGSKVNLLEDESGEEKVYTFEHPRTVQRPFIAAVMAYFRGEIPNPCSAEEAADIMEMLDSFTQNKKVL